MRCHDFHSFYLFILIISLMDPVILAQLREGISQAIDKGRSRDEIEEFMRTTGYSQEEIDHVFAEMLSSDAEEIREALDELEGGKEKNSENLIDRGDETSNKTICKECGFSNWPNSNFCGGCGKKLK